MPEQTITIERWIHAITVEAQYHGWHVEEFDARHHGPTHIIMDEKRVVTVFARPSGGKLLAQHTKPFARWSELSTKSHDRHGSTRVVCLVVTPTSRELLWAILAREGDSDQE